MPIFEALGHIIDHVRPVVHPFLDKDGELYQLSRVMKYRKREYQARELAQSAGGNQTTTSNPDQAEGTDTTSSDPTGGGLGGDSALSGDPSLGGGGDGPGGLLHDVLDWVSDLF